VVETPLANLGEGMSGFWELTPLGSTGSTEAPPDWAPVQWGACDYVHLNPERAKLLKAARTKAPSCGILKLRAVCAKILCRGWWVVEKRPEIGR
jgi:hypothetical protein